MGAEFQRVLDLEIREIQREVNEAVKREIDELMQNIQVRGLNGFFPPDIEDEA